MRIHGKGHDHRPEYDEGRAKKEPQEHIDAVLDGIDVTGHTCDQC